MRMIRGRWNLDVIDLGSLQTAAEIDVDGFPFREDVQRRGAGFAVSIPGVLGPAKRQVHFGADRRARSRRRCRYTDRASRRTRG